MEKKQSALAVGAIVIASLSLIFALVAFGRIAGMGKQAAELQRDVMRMQEQVRVTQAENAKLQARVSAQQHQLDAIETRQAEIQLRIDHIAACVRAGKCAEQLG